MSVNKNSAAFIIRKGNARAALNEISKNLIRAFNQLSEATQEGTKIAAEKILKRSLELCPIDTGALRTSARVISPKRSRKEVRGKISAAGIDPVFVVYDHGGKAPYAVFVHEILRYRHDPPTQAKFLQTAMDEAAAEVLTTVANEAKKNLGGGK